jgi:hemolysin III
MNDSLVLWRMRNPVRGLLHGVSAAVALVGAIWLAIEADSTKGRLSLLVFGAGLTLLFLTSALYHSVPWSDGATQRMRRLDHSMIFVLISATFTPFGVLTLDGWPRMAALLVAWGLASAGVGAVVKGSGGANRRRVAAMTGLGWLSVLLAAPVGRQLGAGALTLLVAGGAIYSVGGLLFAFEWPRLWPRVFSYHEVFHTLVVLAAALHFAAVYHYLLPLAVSQG